VGERVGGCVCVYEYVCASLWSGSSTYNSNHFISGQVVLRVRPPNEPHVGKDRIVHVLDGQVLSYSIFLDWSDLLKNVS
jgi:hypothetical protein